MKRKVAVIGAYLGPNLKADIVHAALEFITDAVLRVKDGLRDPFIVVTGDFNGWKITEAIGDYPDMAVTPSPPTRGTATLDIVASNFVDLIKASVKEPLWSE